MGIRESEQSLLCGRGTAEVPGHPRHAAECAARAHDFEPFVEGLCRGFYAQVMGRSLAPGRYFRLLLLRGHRFGTRDRVARDRLVGGAQLSAARPGGRSARSFDDLTDAAPDRCRDAPRHLHVGATTIGGIAQGEDRGDRCHHARGDTPRCAASCGATPARAIRRF